MDTETIIKVVNELIGKTWPVGETLEDEKREDNLMKLIDLTNWCLDGIRESAEYSEDMDWSKKKNGQRAYGALLDYQKWIGEVLDEN